MRNVYDRSRQPSRKLSPRNYRRAIARMETLEPRILLSIVTDYSNVPQTAHPALPAKYASYTDPDFGTKVIRLTDASDGNENHNAYSYWPSFNKDNTRIMIYKSTRAELYSFNPTTMAISDLGALFTANAPDGTAMDWQDAIWSASDPNTIYCHANTGSKIYAYNVNTHVYTLVHNFASDAGWAANDYIAQISKSMDDNTFAFTRKQYGTWAVLGWEAYRVSTNSAVKFVANSNIDEVQVDKGGNWVVEKYADSSGDNVWNLSTGTATWLVDGSPDYSPDHSDMGTGFIVAAENWQNRTLARNLSTPHSYTTVFTPPAANEGGALWQDGHISMLMDGDQWALKSLEYTGTKTGPFLRELFLVSTDGTGRVIRFAHNYTVNVADYWHNSFGNISRDGRFAITTSDMGDPTRTDVYIIRVPIPGDANLDYLVDGTDLAIYNANAGGSNKTWAQGDWNADHLVNSADLALWTANQTNPGTPTVTISANDPTATEAAGNAGQWTVTRTGSTSAALTVNITKSGTAVSGTDYSAIGTTVTIPVGASSAVINLTPTQDSLIEGTETAIITLASGTGYTVGSPSAATVNITDDDKPIITIAATDAAAAEAALNTGTYTLTRTGTYQGTAPALTVNYAISGTATNGSDYNSLSGSVTFASGATTAAITLTPIDDATVESTETAILTLSANANYTVGSPSAATVNITDNDTGGGSGPAYDGFGYTVGGGANWNGGAGGAGWGGNWSVATPADASVLSGSLTWSNLSTSGNKVTLWHQDTANRNTSMSFGTDGTSRWVGVLMNSAFSGGTNPNLGGSINLGGGQLQIGTVWNAPVALRTNIGGSESFAQSTFTPTANSTYFVVARIDYGATDTVRLWVNPTPGTQPSDASASAILTLPAGQSFSVGNNITLNGGGYYNLAQFDELRYGSTYADVAPSSGSPPAAPTNLLANPRTTDIQLSWADNSNNETGFKIWRSTDNATWGSPITTTAAGATAYTDSTVTQGTAYYYKVAATNGSGDSASAGMTSARATVLGSDDFNYATFNGGAGGYGFSNNWTVSAPADSGTTAGSLTYSSGTHALVTSGNRVWLWHQATASRNTSTTYGTNGTSRWLGFLTNAVFNGGTNPIVGGEVDLGTELKIGSVFNSNISLRSNIGGSETFAASSTPITANTTYFLVVRIDYGTTDVVRLWVNPVPGVTPSDASASATLTLPAGQSFAVGSNVTLNGGGYYSQTTFDELRYGLSYAAVAPDPIVEAGSSRRSPAAPPTQLKSWSLPVTVRTAAAAVATTLSAPESLQLRTDHLDWSAAADPTSYHTYNSDEAIEETPEDPANEDFWPAD